MSKWIAAISSAAALLLATPVLAAGPVALEEGKAWTHAETGLSIPGSADGFRRFEGRDHGSSQSDVMFQFDDPKTQTRATLYLFRAGTNQVSIWADRAEVSMLGAESSYGKYDRNGRLWSRISPWSNAKDSAIRIVYPVGGAKATSTGLLLAVHGDWLIKVRMTSSVMSAAEMEMRLASFLSALDLPAAKSAAQTAAAMTDCKDKLENNSAKLVSRDDPNAVLGAGLINAAAPGAVMAEPGAKDGDTSVFCRDASTTPVYGVYRPNGRKNHYIMAIGDGGVTMVVGPDFGATVAKAKPQFSVTVLTTDRVVGLMPYQTLPSPKQTFDSLGSPQAVYLVSRLPGKEKEVQVFSPGK